MPYQVRRFKDEDTKSVLAIAKWLHKNSRYKDFNLDKVKLTTLFKQSLNEDSPTHLLLATQKQTGKVVGYLHGYVGKMYFGEDIAANDLAIVILPKHRKEAKQILQIMFLKFEEWAKSKGAAEITIGSSTRANGNGYKSFLNKQGYSDMGFLVEKRIR